MVAMHKAGSLFSLYSLRYLFMSLGISTTNTFGPPPTAQAAGDDEDEHVCVCVCSGIPYLLS